MVEAVIRSPEYEDLCVWMPFIWSQLAEMPPDPRRELPIRVRAAHLLGLGQARKSGRMLLALLTEAKTPRPLRIECAIALARLGLPKAAEGLIPLLDVEDSELQLAVIAALGRTGSPRALAPLLDRWDAHEKTLREPLRLALRALGRVSAIDALLSRWPRSEDPAQPPAAAVIEGDRWTSTEGPAWVRAQLARPQAAARADAAAVLGMIGDPSDVPRLARMVAGDDDEEVRWIAAAAARRLSGETDLTP
jgi:HEAT repeat protein